MSLVRERGLKFSPTNQHTLLQPHHTTYTHTHTLTHNERNGKRHKGTGEGGKKTHTNFPSGGLLQARQAWKKIKKKKRYCIRFFRK